MVFQVDRHPLIRQSFNLIRGIIPGLLFILSASPVHAQFSDDFSSTELNMEWLGDRHAFSINEGQLMLDTIGSGEAILYRTITYPDSFVIEGYFHLDFSPSSANKLSFYFLADTIEPDSTSGYLMTVGETGSDDALEIYRLDHGNETLLWRGQPGKYSDSPSCRFSLERRVGGAWKLFLSSDKSAPLTQVAQFTDTTYKPRENLIYLFRCEYTSTRSNKFYLDNLAVRRIVPDTVPPQLLDYIFTDGITVHLQYDEKLSPQSLNLSNFTIENSAIATVEYGDDSTEVIIDFTEKIPVVEAQSFTISGIADKVGNITPDTTILLQFYDSRSPETGDLIFTEILPDPDNNGFLPDYEFIELYNASDRYLNLRDVVFADENSDKMLSEYILGPGEFIIICESGAVENYAEYGQVLGVESLPSLNNEGDHIYLSYGFLLLDELEYNDKLYGNPDFRQNGYSLELQNLYDPCASAVLKWDVSQGELKATPGKINSRWNTMGTVKAPEFKYYSMPADQLIALNFNKTLSSDVSKVKVNLNPAIPVIDVFADKNILKIMLGLPLKEGVHYELSITGLDDCAGNEIREIRILLIGTKNILEPGDLIVNEILFDPPTGTEQYIELKNCTESGINLSHLIFESYEDSVKQTFSIKENRIMLPGDFIVLSEKPADISDTYTIKHPYNLIKVETFPSLDREMGEFKVIQHMIDTNLVIDSILYDEDFHSYFLDETKGVSLERLGCGTDGFNPAVWNSAAQTENYGTPTYENSQLRVITSSDADKLFELLSPTFSPDGDGYEDNLIIQYTGKMVAQRVRLEIYDLHGRLVKELYNNTGVSVHEILKWDGSTGEMEIALPGIYLLYAVVYDESGDKQLWKTSCVLAL